MCFFHKQFRIGGVKLANNGRSAIKRKIAILDAWTAKKDILIRLPILGSKSFSALSLTKIFD